MQTTPVRIQRSRKHKQVSPNGLPIVYVGRPTKWGNPFKVGDVNDMGKIVTVEMAVSYYRFYLSRKYKEHLNVFLEPLKGKNLSCWCPLDKPCHADVLLELANS
jgi:hypothetical protein